MGHRDDAGRKLVSELCRSIGTFVSRDARVGWHALQGQSVTESCETIDGAPYFEGLIVIKPDSSEFLDCAARVG